MARAAWLVPSVVLVAVAIPRLLSGAAAEAAFPAPIYMVLNYPMPQKTYAAAAQNLEHTDSQDGDQTIAAAEAGFDSGSGTSKTILLVRKGLTHAPVNARGWTLLAEALLAEKREKAAAQAMSLALTLGPFDYWIAGRRAHACAELWNALSPTDRDACVNQARLLWDVPALRPQIALLVQTPEGVAVLLRAIANDSQKIRDINRFLATVTRERSAP